MSKELQQIIDTVKAEISKITESSSILLAVSGGPDSLALLDICVNEIPLLKERIHVAYIHHGLRKNADKEKDFVKFLAKKSRVPFHTTSIKIKKTADVSIEEIARIKRYDALKKIAKKACCKAIITAHTLDDQVETILLNLITGAGLKGLSGMQILTELENGLLLLRPLLSITKRKNFNI